MHRSTALNSKDELQLHKVRQSYEKARHAKRRAILLAMVAVVMIEEEGDATMEVVLAAAVAMLRMEEFRMRALRQMDSWIERLTRSGGTSDPVYES